jgi:squalene synthase HpnC
MIRRVLASESRPTPVRPGLRIVQRPPGAAPQGRFDHLPAAPGGRWTVEASYAYCESIVREHHENFPVASRFVPEALRRHVWAVYAFARTADDIADEPAWAGRRAEALDEFEDLLLAAYHGQAEHPLFIALADTVERRDIPIVPLQDLLTAFRMDLNARRYSTFEALRGYTRYSAEPVGQILLYIFDYRDPVLHNYANDIATALELTHFLQDLPVDLSRGRLYVPEEDLRHFGVSEDDLRGSRCTAAFRDMMRFEVARARALFQRGRPLTTRLGRDLGFELNLIWQGGVTILDKIDAADGDVLSRRPRLRTIDKVRMVARSAARRWPLLGGRE